MNNILIYRELSGLSRKQLAELANTSPQQIFRLEKGHRKLTKEWAIRLAPHLNVTPKKLMFSNPEGKDIDTKIQNLVENLSMEKKIKLLDFLSSVFEETHKP